MTPELGLFFLALSPLDLALLIVVGLGNVRKAKANRELGQLLVMTVNQRDQARRSVATWREIASGKTQFGGAPLTLMEPPDIEWHDAGGAA